MLFYVNVSYLRLWTMIVRRIALGHDKGKYSKSKNLFDNLIYEYSVTQTGFICTHGQFFLIQLQIKLAVEEFLQK